MKIDLSKLGVTPGEWVPGKDGQSVITTDKELCDKIEKEDPSCFKHYGGELVCESIHDKDKALVCATKEMLEILIDALYEDSYDYVKAKNIVEKITDKSLSEVFDLTVKE